MKYYDNSDNFRMREFTVEVALQSGEYKGKIRRKIQGRNCFGLDVLDIIGEDFIYEADQCELIDCNIELIGEDDEGTEWFKYYLKNDEGDICEGEDECRCANRLITGINIVECKVL